MDLASNLDRWVWVWVPIMETQDPRDPGLPNLPTSGHPNPVTLNSPSGELRLASVAGARGLEPALTQTCILGPVDTQVAVGSPQWALGLCSTQLRSLPSPSDHRSGDRVCFACVLPGEGLPINRPALSGFHEGNACA